MISRRSLLAAASGALLSVPFRTKAGEIETFGGASLRAAVQAAEARSGGRLGVAVLDTGNGARFGHGADARFPLCSTFKFLLAGLVLAEVDQGRLTLDRTVPVTGADILDYSPVTETLAGRSATVAALCGAAVSLSDNGAANLLLKVVGGPEAVTRFARGIGDPVTRLDRTEPDLNVVPPGDTRDTTSPDAMLADLDRLVLGRALLPASRARLTDWLVATSTGKARLRAGFPAHWRIGDKTGTGPARTGTANDIAVIWPPGRAPVVVASYLTASPLDSTGWDGIHADVGRAVARALGA